MLVNASVLPLGVVHRVPSIIAMAKPTMIISFKKQKTVELLGKFILVFLFNRGYRNFACFRKAPCSLLTGSNSSGRLNATFC